MPITRDINAKSNIRQKTDSDLGGSLGQPVIARQAYVSVAGQTTIPAAGSLPFAIDQNSKDNFDLYVDGKLLTEGSTADYTFAQIDGNNFSAVIQLAAPLAAGLNIQAIKRGLKKDAELGIDARIQALYDAQSAGFQGFVDESARLTAVNGSPSASQFRSIILGRASIPDLANDLRARMGVDRIQIQQLAELQNEVGPAGERIFSVVNDDRNLVRFAGNWIQTNDTNGARPANNTDFLEVTFFGTGLNLLTMIDSSARTFNYVVDGGSSTSGSYPSSASGILTGRNYVSNQVLPVVSGLSLGLHTVRIIPNGASNTQISGFEFLNEAATINVRPGTAYIGGKKLVLSAAQSLAYNSSFDSILRDGVSVGSLSTKGARVVVYQKSDGTIGKSAIEVDATLRNTTSADHSNEEAIRTYSFREFTAGRADDFGPSFFNTSPFNIAFTLDDGTTTLAGSGISVSGSGNIYEGIQFNTTGGFITITFVGTGLDVGRFDFGSASDVSNVLVDGVSQGSLAALGVGGKIVIQKVVSGLPYGTHTVRLTRSNNALSSQAITKFIVYGPKKPSIPAGAVELADYNIVADYVATSSTAQNFVSAGVLRKIGMREVVYTGTWSTAIAANDNRFDSAFNTQTSTSASTFSYQFFGTGIEWNGATAAGAPAWNVTVTIDGSTSYTGVLMQTGSGLSFSAGVITGTSSADGKMRLRITGLSLGSHTIKITTSTSTFVYSDSFDIITPIHSTKTNFQSDIQNTLPVGSCAISDNRKLTPSKDALPAQKAWAQASGVTSSPTTTATALVPMPDMSVSVKTGVGMLDIRFVAALTSNTTAANYCQIFVDGNPVGNQIGTSEFSAGFLINYSNSILVPVGAGTHKVDVYWYTSAGTLTAFTTLRNLQVREA